MGVNKINKKINFVWGAENSAYLLEFRVSNYLYSEIIYSALGNLTKDELMRTD